MRNRSYWVRLCLGLALLGISAPAAERRRIDLGPFLGEELQASFQEAPHASFEGCDEELLSYANLGAEDPAQWHDYGAPPIQSFASSPSGKRIAIQLATRIQVPCERYRHPIVLDVSGNTPKAIQFLHAPPAPWEQHSDLAFLNETILRTEVARDFEAPVLTPVPGFQLGYYFTDVTTGQRKSIEEFLPSVPGAIRHVRALSQNMYLVAYINAKIPDHLELNYRFVRLEIASLSKFQIQSWRDFEIENFNTGIELMAILHDEDMFAADDGVALRLVLGGEQILLKVGAQGPEVFSVPGAELQFFVDGLPSYRTVESEGRVSLLDAKGKVAMAWPLPHAMEIWPRLYYRDGLFIGQYQNHPKYGFFALVVGGGVVSLTDPEFRLIHYNVHRDRVTGLSLNPGGNMVYHDIPFAH
jgi:hypothetical protein